MGMRSLSREGTDNPGLVPVFWGERQIGCWLVPLPAWGYRLAYQVAHDPDHPVKLTTRFDRNLNAVGLEIDDPNALLGWPEFRRA